MNQIDPLTLAAINKAIVRFAKGGSGILTEHGIILTALHCLSASCSEIPLFMGAAWGEAFWGLDGGEYFAKVLYGELVSDLCALGCYDDARPKDTAKFLSGNQSVALSSAVFSPGERFPIEIVSPEGLIFGTGEILKFLPSQFSINSSVPLQGGFSGSPIFHKGELIGVISSGDNVVGYSPYLPALIPPWLLEMRKTETENV